VVIYGCIMVFIWLAKPEEGTPEGHTEFVIVFIFGKAGVIVMTCLFFLIFGIVCPWNCGQCLD
jgi:hypothetical protein